MLLLFFCLISTVQMKDDIFNSNTTHNTSINGKLGKSVVLPCVPKAKTANLTLVLWQFNNTIFPIQFPKIVEDSTERVQRGEYSSILITKLTKEDAMLYKCDAYEGGNVVYTKFIQLVVTGPPHAPKNVRAEPLSENSISVSWLTGNNNDSPLLYHLVEIYTRHGDPNNQQKQVTFPLTSIVFKRLTSFTVYKVKVKAFNAAGSSDFTTPVEATTLAGHPRLKPEIVEVRPGHTWVVVRVFCIPDAANLHGKFRGYLAKVWLGSRVVSNTTVNTTDNKETSIRVGFLKPFTPYRVTVAVYNGRYFGPQASSKFTTLEAVPGTTSIYQISDKKENSFTVWWQDVLEKNGIIKGFKVELYPRNSIRRELLASIEVPPTINNHTFRDLTSYTWYKVRIAARTKVGYGNFSTPYEVLTDVGRPNPPILLRARVNGSQGVLLNWTQPPDQRGSVLVAKTDFKVCWSQDTGNAASIMRKDECIRTGIGAAGPISTSLDTTGFHYSARVPWKVFNAAHTTKITIGLRATVVSIFCTTVSIECEKEGGLSNTLTLKLTRDDQKFLKENASTSKFHLDRTALAGIIAGICMILVIAFTVSIVTWRTSCVYRGYAVAEQQVELYHLSGTPMAPTMLTFEQSIYPAIPIAKLSDHVFEYHADDNAGYQAEFESIERAVKTDWSTTVALLPDNVQRNRYSNIFAYDHTRVILQNLYGKKSDYINANFIDGYQKPRAYIAAQGPLPSTFDDFWQMIWEQNSNVIVMISNFIERGRRKCDQYWPSVGSQTYGVVSVKMVSETQLAFYTIRVFAISNSKCKKVIFTNYLKTLEAGSMVVGVQYGDGVPDSKIPVTITARN